MASPLLFTVRRKQPELVAPAKPTPHEFKLLSDVDDQEGWRFQLPIVQFYRHDGSSCGRDPAKVIKDALAEALVLYHPFAGRLREGSNRKLMVECTGEGVIFVEADAAVTLQQFGEPLRPPFPCFDELLHDVEDSGDILNCPLLLIQVTRLACGGFVLAVRFNHTMCDGEGLVQFLSAMAELARGGGRPSVSPVWRRDLLSASDPLIVTCRHREFDEVTAPLPDAARSLLSTPGDGTAHRTFFFGAREVANLRKRLSPHLRARCSTFDVVTACLWRCRVAALGLGSDEDVGVLCIVNARKRCSPRLPVGYYGNALATPVAMATAADLRRSPLDRAVELIKKAKSTVTNEYMTSMTNLLLLRNRPRHNFLRTFLVSDLSRLGFDKLDFGWGEPAFGGPALAGYCLSFYIPVKNSAGENGIVVPVYLPPTALNRFVAELEKMTTGVSRVGAAL